MEAPGGGQIVEFHVEGAMAQGARDHVDVHGDRVHGEGAVPEGGPRPLLPLLSFTHKKTHTMVGGG